MRKHYQYTLVFLSVVIVYELYLIFSFKYIDIQKDISINNIKTDISMLETEIDQKKLYFEYINTSAYKDKIAKMSQNRKNPWEEVVFVVSEEKAEQYQKIDIDEQINSQDEIIKPTYWMSNEEKWFYYIFKKDLRD